MYIVALGLTVVGVIALLFGMASKGEAAPFGCLFGLFCIVAAFMSVGLYHDSRSPRARQYNARATIAAATAAVAGATAESELRALERAAATAAAAVKGGGDG